MQRFWLPLFAVPLLLAGCKTNEAAPTPAAPSSAQPATVASTAPAASTAAPSTASAPASLLAKGAPAPDFHLEGSDGKTHALADGVGKQVVVIAWFPKAFTSG